MSDVVKPRRAFTRVELIVTAALLLLVGAAAVLAVLDARRRSRDAETLSRVRQVQAELTRFRAEAASYPASLDGLAVDAEGFTYAPSPEDCAPDAELICREYVIRFQLEGRLGTLEGGECEAGDDGIVCRKPD